METGSVKGNQVRFITSVISDIGDSYLCRLVNVLIKCAEETARLITSCLDYCPMQHLYLTYDDCNVYYTVLHGASSIAFTATTSTTPLAGCSCNTNSSLMYCIDHGTVPLYLSNLSVSCA